MSLDAPRPTPSAAAAVAALALAIWGGCSTSPKAPLPKQDGREELVVERGNLEDVLLLSGELEAASAEKLVVPRSDHWMLKIRSLHEDGREAKQGEAVVEFDNSSALSRFQQEALAVDAADYELTRQKAAGVADEALKVFELEKARTVEQQAELDRAVPQDTIAIKVYEERQLALRRARAEVERAQEELDTHRKSQELELKVKRIELDKARSELKEAERTLTSLVLRSPREGLLVIEQNWQQGRKYQVGDIAHPTQTVASLPDLSKMRVRASMSDVDDGTVKVGMPARCVLDAHPETIYQGVVESLSPVARPRGRESMQQLYAVTVALAKTDPARMRPGMSVRVEIVRQQAQNVLLAPRKALDLSNSKAKARTAAGKLRPVEITWCNAEMCAIGSGLEHRARLLALSDEAGVEVR
jgi:HlyD family secretion protein